MRTTTRTLEDGRAAVRGEDVYDTDIDDLWDACTSPDRLARWIARVSGDLREGSTIHATYTSTFTGPVRIDVCEPPRHLLLTNDPGTDEESRTEVWLTAEGERTRLVVEERGLPAGGVHFYGAGWQTHLEDLATYVADGAAVHPEGWSAEAPAPRWHARFQELTPDHEQR